MWGFVPPSEICFHLSLIRLHPKVSSQRIDSSTHRPQRIVSLTASQEVGEAMHLRSGGSGHVRPTMLPSNGGYYHKERPTKEASDTKGALWQGGSSSLSHISPHACMHACMCSLPSLTHHTHTHSLSPSHTSSPHALQGWGS